ncbi:MAG: TIGR00730 family Rossman fold protein [Actinobacteria bacterium]|nr:TIGR00730 family Rossman fold protein [Actinomycetota bacterium]MTH92845.1 TIGR00730 family Rossman fold protein [Actinomycetota bacterium]
MNSIAVYCGSSTGNKSRFMNAAQELGALFAQESIELVYGGGGAGLMGAVADAVLEAGGRVTGVITEALWEREAAHQHLTSLRIVPNMHERKFQMSDLADAFIALPGGFGTLDELFEVITWNQLGIHSKPCGILNVEGFYDQLISFMNSMVADAFVNADHLGFVVVRDHPKDLLESLQSWKLIATKKPVKSDDR